MSLLTSRGRHVIFPHILTLGERLHVPRYGYRCAGDKMCILVQRRQPT